ncbi:MAG: hypothetical protein ACI8RE_000497 [Ilumatobacter sp.]|jgi:hypothetical protein
MMLMASSTATTRTLPVLVPRRLARFVPHDTKSESGTTVSAIGASCNAAAAATIVWNVAAMCCTVLHHVLDTPAAAARIGLSFGEGL